MKQCNSIIMLVGLPCTGKSTWLSQLGYTTYDKVRAVDRWLVLSTDHNVEQMGKADGIDTYDAAWSKYIKDADAQFYADFEWACTYGFDMVIDRTNLTVKSRKRLFDIINKAGHSTMVNARVFGLDLDPYQWLNRMSGRPEKTIPLHVLLTMGKSFEKPTREEGFANVYI